MKGRKIRRMLLKILIGIIILILLLIIAALIFMRAYPEFGGRPNKADRKNYAERAQGYYDGKHFYYPSEWLSDPMTSNNQVSTKECIPNDSLPVLEPDFTLAADNRPVLKLLKKKQRSDRIVSGDEKWIIKKV